MVEILKRANTEKLYKITHQDLPLSCPNKDMRVWDAHPRVFLPIKPGQEVQCRYCGAKYQLVD